MKNIQEQNHLYQQEIESILSSEKTRKKIAQENKNVNMLEILKVQYNLTPREVEVLTCIWKKMCNSEIAEHLFISVSTVKFHVSKLYSKLEINSRNQAMSLFTDNKF